jgi:hypothetical protein
MSRWFRHYGGMMRDVKIVGVAARTRQPVERVGFIWAIILEDAAERQAGGAYQLDGDELAYFLRIDPAEVEVILSEMEGTGLITDGHVCKWSTRQFESDTSATRTAKWRGNKKTRDGHVTPQRRRVTGPEPEADTDSETEGSSSSLKNEIAQAAATRAEGLLLGQSSLDDKQLLVVLLEAAGVSRERMPATMRSVRTIRELMANGYDLDGDILPVIRSKRGKADPKSWNYYSAAICEAESGSEPLPPDRMTLPVLDTDPAWPTLARRWCAERKIRECPVKNGGWRFPLPWVVEATRAVA